jgi:predicted nucleotidyltransferase
MQRLREPIVGALRGSLAMAGPEVVAAYLFGSVARGEAGPASDVDVAVLLSPEPSPVYASLELRLEGDLERALARSVEVVVLNLAPIDLVHRVLRDGILLLDREPSTRVRFEVRARNEYFDLLPFLRRYRRLPEHAA